MDVSEKAKIGDGTKIWHQSQIRENAEIGGNCNIGKGVYIDFGVKIGSNCKIQNYVSVYYGVVIEDNVFIGPSVTFTNDLYPRAFIWSEEKVSKTLIRKGVVTKDIPDYALVCGNPARIVGFVCECGRKLEDFEENKKDEIVKGICKFCKRNILIKESDFIKWKK